MKKFWRPFLCFCLLFFFAVPFAKTFSISPLKYHLTVAPGTQGYTLSLAVKNDDTGKKAYLLKVISAKQDDQGRLTYGGGNNFAEMWVKPQTESVEIAGGKEKNVNFFINVPQDAAPGSYYLGLAVETAAENKANVGLSGQLIAPLLLQVAGVANESLSIETWRHPKMVFWQRHWMYDFILNNSGNVEVPAKATVRISNWRGDQVYGQQPNLDELILPGSGRAYRSEVKLPYGNFYLPGPYSAELVINYGKTGQVISAVQTVWFFPPYIIIICSVIILLIAYSLLKKKKHA